MNQPIPSSVTPWVRADCTQLGLSVDASVDGGKTWQNIQLTPYQSRPTPTVRAYSSAIDPARDREGYFAELDRKGISYKRVNP